MSPENWTIHFGLENPLDVRQLWQDASFTEQRRALAHRWRLRCSPRVESIPRPCRKAEPLAWALDFLERRYRDPNSGLSYSRGGKQEWER